MSKLGVSKDLKRGVDEKCDFCYANRVGKAEALIANPNAKHFYKKTEIVGDCTCSEKERCRDSLCHFWRG